MPSRKPSKPTFDLILLGDPGAGKATHGERLAKAYGLRNLDMGRELRALKNGPLQKRIGAGKLAPSAIVRHVFEQFISLAPEGEGILFNGTPKMIGEARLVERMLRKRGRTNIIVMYLTIPHDEIIRRLAGRTEMQGGKRVKRAEDSLASIKERMHYYRTEIPKVTRFFAAKYPFKRISTLGTKPDTYRRIKAFLDSELV
jgi:adenylate kinase